MRISLNSSKHLVSIARADGNWQK